MKNSGSSRQSSPNRTQPYSPLKDTGGSERGGLCYGSSGHIAICCIAAILASLAVASFQSGFFSVVRPFGIAPDLCLAFTVAAAMFFGSRFGAVSGIASGFFLDALTVGGLSFNIVIYFICGTLVGLFKMPEPRPFKDVWRYIAGITASCILKKIVEALWVILTSPSLDASKLFSELLIRGVICTVLCSPIAYIPTAVSFCIYKRAAATRGTQKRY